MEKRIYAKQDELTLKKNSRSINDNCKRNKKNL